MAITVFYVTGNDAGGASHDLAKFFDLADAEKYLTRHRGMKNVRVEARAEDPAAQHEAHQPLFAWSSKPTRAPKATIPPPKATT